MITVYFLYGLAFFALGLTMALARRRRSDFRFVKAIGALAAFGLLHGLHEWLEMFQLIGVFPGRWQSLWFEAGRVILLAASFLALLA